MDLTNIQKKLSDYIYNYKVKEEELAEILPTKYTKKNHLNSINIYRQNILFHIIDVMGDTYEATKASLGEKNFNFFVREYLREFPSQVINIDEYGENFPRFLSEREELKRDSPHIKEIALLDHFWANTTTAGQKINLLKGSFDIWRALLHKKPVTGVLKIDSQNTETVISVSLNKELFITKE